MVWSGYILSGAATATLTVGILMRRFKNRLDDYDRKLDELQESVNELKSNDKKLDELQESVNELKK